MSSISPDSFHWLLWFIPFVSLIGTSVGAFVSVKVGLNGTKKDIKNIKEDINRITKILTEHNNEIGNLHERCDVEFPNLKNRLDRLEKKINKS